MPIFQIRELTRKHHLRNEIRFKQFEKIITETVPIVLTFHAFASFMKISSKKHVIIKNFDDKKIKNITGTFYLRV